jgi:hypothetical protein
VWSSGLLQQKITDAKVIFVLKVRPEGYLTFYTFPIRRMAKVDSLWEFYCWDHGFIKAKK